MGLTEQAGENEIKMEVVCDKDDGGYRDGDLSRLIADWILECPLVVKCWSVTY